MILLNQSGTGLYNFENGLWMPDKNGLGYKFVIDWLNENCPSGNLNIKY